MAAYRMWRFYVTATGGAATVALGELILATSPGGAQAATGGTATASSTTGVNGASRAFDGTMSSANYWQSTMARAFIQYDMGVGNTLDVAEMRVYFNTASAEATAFPADFHLLASSDGSEWLLQRSWSTQSFVTETRTFEATPQTLTGREVLRRDARYNYAAVAGPAPTVARVLPHRAVGFGAKDFTLPTTSSGTTGQHYIAGSTTLAGQPVRRRVNLYAQHTGLLVRTTYTGTDGQYRFDWIAAGPWTVIGVDPSATHNSVTYAHVVATPMP